MESKVSLNQWRAFRAVVDAGGYASAAEKLSKSQSAVSYAISQLETALGVAVFEVRGRRAVLTRAGEVLYRRANHLLMEAQNLEDSARRLAMRVEPLIGLACEIVVPPERILKSVALFSRQYPETRLELYETVMSGTEDAMVQRKVDLAISARVPPGFAGEFLMQVTFRGVTSPDHPLQHLGRPVTFDDLRHHRQSIIRDSGLHRRYSEGWQEAEQRLTVTSIHTALEGIRMGLTYAWLPESYIQQDLEAGRLNLLPLETPSERVHSLYLIFSDRDLAGPATRHLADILRTELPAQQ